MNADLPPDRSDIARGRPEAFERLYESFAAPMLRVALSLTGLRADAEDAMQQACELVSQDRDALISEDAERLHKGNLLLPMLLSAYPASMPAVWKEGDQRLELYQASAASSPR